MYMTATTKTKRLGMEMYRVVVINIETRTVVFDRTFLDETMGKATAAKWISNQLYKQYN